VKWLEGGGIISIRPMYSCTRALTYLMTQNLASGMSSPGPVT